MLKRNLCAIVGTISAAIICGFLSPGATAAGAETYVGGFISVDTVWTASEGPYIVASDVIVEAGVTLTLEPGVEVKFDGYFELLVKGDLSAVGSPSAKIFFTSNQAAPGPGDWARIMFDNSGNGDQIEYAVIEYAEYGVYCKYDSNPVILDSRITNNRYGIYNYYYNPYSGTPNPVVNYSEIHSNAEFNYYNYNRYRSSYNWSSTTLDAKYNWWGTADPSLIAAGTHDYASDSYKAVVAYVPFLDASGGNLLIADSRNRIYVQGSVAEDTTLPPGDYYVLGPYLVPPGRTLTIEQGGTFAFDQGGALDVKGDLLVQGTAENRVMFTSASDMAAPGDWVGIRFFDSGNGDQIEYAVIEYAEYGVYCKYDSNPVILDSRITNNRYGIYNYYYSTYSGNPHPVVSYSEIYSNEEFNYYNYNRYRSSYNWSSTTLDAKYNWWGTADPSLIAAGTHDYASDSYKAVVAYVPFLDASGGAPVVADSRDRTFVQGSVAEDTTLASGDYHVLGSYLVPPGRTFTIEAGVTLAFEPGTALDVKGDLLVQGTTENQARFTSASDTPAPGDWVGIRFIDAGNDDLIEYAVIEYAVYGVYCKYDSNPVILDSRITNNRYGIYNYYYSTYSGNPHPVVNYSEIHSNAEFNYYNYNRYRSSYNWSSTTLDAKYNWWGTADPSLIAAGIHDYASDSYKAVVAYVPYLDASGGDPLDTDAQGWTYVQGSVAEDVTLPPGDYHVLGPYVIHPGRSLTVEQGATLTFEPGASLDVKGDLLVQGAAGKPVTLTSATNTPAPGDWLGIRFFDSGDGDRIEYAVIEYAKYGVYCKYDSNPVILHSRLTNNRYGIYNYFYTTNSGTPNPVVNYSEIHSNEEFNYYNYSYVYDWSSTAHDAKYNWWGTADHTFIAAGIHDYASDSEEAAVSYVPFLDASGGSPLTTDSQGRIYIQAGVPADTTLPAGDYHILGSYLVQPGQTLTIEPGVTLAFEPGAALDVQGNLLVQGTAGNHVTFTSAFDTPGPGDWLGIRFFDSGDGDRIEYAVIEYAEYGVYCKNDSNPVILDSRITNNRYGIYNYFYYTSSGIPNPVVNYSEIHSNEEFNYYNYSYYYDWSSTALDARYNWWGTTDPSLIAGGIHDYASDSYKAVVAYVPYLDASGGIPLNADSRDRTYVQGSVAEDTTLPPGDYHVLGSFLVQPDQALTIEPGVTLVFEPGAALDVKGELIVQGTAANYVRFTSAADTPAPGDWVGIRFFDSGNGDRIEYAVIEFAEYGVYCKYDSNPVIQDSRITNNHYGIYNYFYNTSSGTPNPVVNFSEIHSNGEYNYFNYNSYGTYYNWSSTTLDAKYNWWGAEDFAGIRAEIWDTEDDARLAAVEIDGFMYAFSPNGDESKDIIRFVYDVRTSLSVGRNLLSNPGAETGDLAGWQTLSGFGVRSSGPDPLEGDLYFFPGAAANADLYQVVDLTLHYTDQELDSGELEIAAGGYQRSYHEIPEDEGHIMLEFLDELDHVIQAVAGDSVADWDAWVLTDLRTLIPPQTRKIRYSFLATRYNGTNLNANLDACFVNVYLAPHWTVTIKNGSSETIRTLHGRGSAEYLAWDGSDDLGRSVADGAFTYEIQADQDGTPLIDQKGDILLDTELPAAGTISSPTDDQQVFNIVEVLGRFEDTYGVYRYSLEFSEGAAPTEWTEFWSGTSAPASGVLGAWNTKPVPNTVTYPNGVYTIRLTVKDLAGNASQASVLVDLYNFYITGVSRLNSTIDTSRGETARITFSLSRAAGVFLKIYPEWEDSRGTLVREIHEDYSSAGTYSLAWDGKDGSGRFVPDEAYIFILEGIDSNHNREIYQPAGGHIDGSNRGTVDRAYDLYRNDVWQMTHYNQSPGRISMKVTPDEGEPFNVFSMVPFEAGSSMLTWDGRDPAGNPVPGKSQIYFNVPTTLRPNYIITKGFVPGVAGTPGNISIKSNPFMATLSYGQFFKIDYHLDTQCRVSVKLLPPGIAALDAPGAIAILSDQLQDAGDHELTWDALDPDDPTGKRMLISRDGPYTFAISATNPVTGGTSLKRGVINLYQ